MKILGVGDGRSYFYQICSKDDYRLFLFEIVYIFTTLRKKTQLPLAVAYFGQKIVLWFLFSIIFMIHELVSSQEHKSLSVINLFVLKFDKLTNTMLVHIFNFDIILLFVRVRLIKFANKRG